MAEVLEGLWIGAIAGLLSGLAGVGGGIVIVPLLVLMRGLDQHTAQGTSLLAFSFPVLATATWQYWKHGRVNGRMAVWTATGLAVAGLISASFTQAIPTPLLRKVFALFLIGVGGYLFWRSYYKIAAQGTSRWPTWAVGLLAGSTAGLLSGLTGLGGGIVIVPFLMLIGKLDQHTAQGTSLLTLSMPVLIFALWPYAKAGRVAYLTGIGVAIGLLFSSGLSARLAQQVPSTQLSRLFSLIVIGIGGYQFLR